MVHLLLAVIYLSFISLGLPDGLLGAAWPSMYGAFGVPVSYAGIVSMIIAVGTVISSLQSDRLTRRFGTGKVTAASVAMTAAALLGFSCSNSFLQICILAVPYGLGAGSVDASLNNYVALHYASRHMSWLHCMWGIGAAVGPYVMGYALTGGQGWQAGYRYVFILQIILTVILILSLPLWKERSCNEDPSASCSSDQNLSVQESSAAAASNQNASNQNASDQNAQNAKPLSLAQIIRIPGAKEVMGAFFCYCALEQTAGLWAASYLTLWKGVSATQAASFASMFYIGITAGRAISGFVTIKLNDTQMTRLGQVIIAIGIVVLFLPFGANVSLAGLILIGLGCAPIYPCVIHATPERFGAERSQALIGVQMAAAYIGICTMPPLFGLIANNISVGLFPVFLSAILIIMVILHERLVRIHP